MKCGFSRTMSYAPAERDVSGQATRNLPPFTPLERGVFQGRAFHEHFVPTGRGTG
jgi:hypothetical protein